jgi:hypothetical protein
LDVGPRVLRLTNATMAEFARILQASILDRPAPAAPQPGRAETSADNAAALPDFFTAIREQLGLKLESTKEPVDVLVIDHAEKPSAN